MIVRLMSTVVRLPCGVILIIFAEPSRMGNKSNYRPGKFLRHRRVPSERYDLEWREYRRFELPEVVIVRFHFDLHQPNQRGKFVIVATLATKKIFV
jgi:hypothetical protein